VVGKKPVKTTIKKPTVDGFKLKGKLEGDFKKMVEVLRTITFIEIAQEKSAINISYVESRDINKNPYLFSIIKIKEDEVEVLYSVTPEISPTKRRVDVIRYLLNILSLVDEEYSVDNKILYQLLEDSMKKVMDSVSVEYSRLFTERDALKKDIADYKKKVERLTEQNDALSSQNYEIKTENDELKVRLQKLESVSDETLKTKIQEWIVEHNGSINVSEFAKVYSTPETKVEEILNQLVSEGYLEVVG